MTTLASIPPSAPAGGPLPPDLDLTLVARRPARLPAATARFADHLPVPVAPAAPGSAPRASIIVVTHDNLAFTKLCLTSLLANTGAPAYELIVVDNGSTDRSPQWLQALAEVNPHVRLICETLADAFFDMFGQTQDDGEEDGDECGDECDSDDDQPAA